MPDSFDNAKSDPTCTPSAPISTASRTASGVARPPASQNDAWYNRRGRVTDWSDFDQVVHGDFPGGLKDLDTSNPDVQDALIRVYEDWIDKAGLDGFRIDTVKHVEREFWRYFTQKVRQRLAPQGKKKFLMFGEAFDGDDELVGSFTKNGELDGVFYFPQYYGVFRSVFAEGKPTSWIEGLLSCRNGPIDKCACYGDKGCNKGTLHYGETPSPATGVAPKKLTVNFLDNHDVATFAHEVPQARAPLGAARIARSRRSVCAAK